MTFPEHLLKLRLSNGLSQQAAADIAGIALRTYQYYERGQREPIASTLIALADYYDMSLDELVCRKWEPRGLSKASNRAEPQE